MKKSLTSEIKNTFKDLKSQARDEVWKYLDLKEVLSQPFCPASHKAPDIDPTLLDCMTLFRGGLNHYVFVNGLYQPKLSTHPKIGNGLLISPLSHALKTHKDIVAPFLEKREEDDKDPFCSLNDSSFRDGLFLYVPENTSLPYPVHLWFLDVDGDKPQVFSPRNMFVAETGAMAKIVIHREGFNSKPILMNSLTDVRLHPGADVSIMEIQKPKEKSFHFHTTYAELGEGSSFKSLVTSWGNRVTRNVTRVLLNGLGAQASLDGLSVLSDKQQLFNQTAVYHRAEKTTSRQLFKNILSGESRSEYSGLVSIQKGARESDSKQLNRNLVLSKGSRAHARPILKIDTDDVKCSHGATMGELEDRELFYLRSRGIPEREARSILMFGFAGEILRGVEPNFVREELEKEVRSKVLK